jgi:hypothetical protein
MGGINIAASVPGIRHTNKLLFFVLCAAALSLIPVQQALAAPGYFFEPTGSGNNTYTDIATSGDGTKVLATRWGGMIHSSSDGGQSWSDLAAAGTRNWRSVTMSQDGQVIAAAPCGNAQLQISSDGGSTWAPRGTNRNWTDVQMSADSQTMIAISSGGCAAHTVASSTGLAWFSPDVGGTWTQLSTPAGGITAVAVSPDGGTLLIGNALNEVYKSVNNGTTWDPVALTPTAGDDGGWAQISYSRDGSTIMAIMGFSNTTSVPAGLYISRDNGVTWTLSTTFLRRGVPGFAVSGDGQKIVVQNTNSAAPGLKSSLDGGATWSDFAALPGGDGGWHFSMSDNGSVAYATTSKGTSVPVYKAGFVNVPTAPRNLVVTPGLNQATLTWDAPLDNGGSPIADYLVEYSTDNGITWKTFAHPASAATSIVVDKLNGSILHLFRVSAINVAGAGPSVMPPIEGTPEGGPYNPDQGRLADAGLNTFAITIIAVLLIVVGIVVSMRRPVLRKG